MESSAISFGRKGRHLIFAFSGTWPESALWAVRGANLL